MKNTRSSANMAIPTVRRLLFIIFIVAAPAAVQAQYTRSHGGIVRADTSQKRLAVLFSADEYTDGIGFIRQALKEQAVHASFFFTGRLLENPRDTAAVRQLLEDGNYVGSHSFGHLLYCDWTKRDSLLVTKKEFVDDLKKSYVALGRFGITQKDAQYFMPPYEWYNDSISQWTQDMGLQLINFTPGTYSNADYTTPDMGSRYINSDTIFARILRYEAAHHSGLNGFLLLLHAGTAPERTDKMYFQLPALISALKSRGYQLMRIDELLKSDQSPDFY